MKLLSFEDLFEKGIRKSRAQINRDIKAGRFPRPVRLGKSPAWPETEIDEYIRSLIAARDAQGAE